MPDATSLHPGPPHGRPAPASTSGPGSAPDPELRGATSAGRFTTYLTLLRWNGAQIGPMLALVVVVQAALAAGIVVGFGLLIPDVDTATARFLSTGAPTVLLLTVGLVMVPQAVAQARLNGTFTYLRSLPVPRPLVLAADLSLWLLVALPAIPVTMLVAWLRYGLTFRPDWPVLVPAVLLVAVMATSVGYAIAVSCQPMLAQVLTQVLIFFVMLFSPVTFPASQLPGWYRSLHDVLPVQAGADLIRAGLAADHFSADGRDLLVLTAWTALGLAVTLRALVRRG